MNEPRVIKTGNSTVGLDLNHPFTRYPDNPILTSRHVNEVWTDTKRKVVTVHNAGITVYNNETVMLFRSHLRNGISVIGKAVSHDGISDWAIGNEPALKPCDENDPFAKGCEIGKQIEIEAGGVEDPRISKIGKSYYITYSAYDGKVEDRVRVCLAVTEDFKEYTRYGPVLDRDMRNVVIFPEIIDGFYYALMRPNDDPSSGHKGGVFREIRLAKTNSIESCRWKLSDQPVMRQSGGPSPFQHKIGPGAPPLKTRHGWINIFHGVRSTMDGNPYVLGIALHELKDPLKVRVSSIPLLFPSADDCKIGPEEYVHVPQVVFTCGALKDDDGTIRIYYGGNDTVMNVGFSHEDILAELCINYPQDPLSGQPLYKI
jgi:predicted GH43/DUF377 family glycosyl hydrolase